MDKYKQALEEVLINLRSIESPNGADEYIDDSIKIIMEALKGDESEDAKNNVGKESRTS